MASSFDVTANVNLNSANLNANAKKIELALGRITGQASEFQKSLDASTARVFAFGATTAVLNSVNQAFKKLVSTTIEVEKRLIEINSIFQASDKTFNKFRNSIFKVAKDTGQAFDTVAEGAGELARQGLSAEETAKRLKASLVLTRISGLGAEKSVKALTAAINGFASASLSAEQIVNKLVAVDTAFAVSAQDLAEAFSRAGSTAEDAGVSFDQLLGLVTAVEQKTARGGAVIGNAFKSIFTRISRGDTIDSLKELGVQIDATQNGIQKLSALSEALTRVSDPTVASQIKELAGGVFQINVVSAALKDLSSETSIFQNAASVAATATNEAFQKNAELNKSIAAQINALIAGLTSLAERIGSITFGPLLENLLGLTTKFTEFLNEALDPEKGSAFIKGLFKTIGNFLSGPAVVVFTVAFAKIFGLVAKFAKDGLKAVFSIGSESAKIKNIEAGIVGLLQKDKQLRNLIASSTASQAQKEAAIINAIRQENSLLTTQAALMSSIASSARAAGVASFSASSGKFKGKFAGGFQQEEAMARMLGAGNNVRAHFGQGTIGGRRFIMNNQEMEIPRFAGGKDSAVIPMYSMGTKRNGKFQSYLKGNITQEQFINNSQLFSSPAEGLKDFNKRVAASGTGTGVAEKKRQKERAKGKKGETDEAGILTLDARNIGLLAAKRGGAVPPFSSTAMDTLSDNAQRGVASIVGAGNKAKINEVRMVNLKSAALSDSRPNLETLFRPTVTRNFADPLFNFSKSIVKDVFKGTDRSSVTSKLKQNSGARLFSKSTEGGIFESALKMMLAGTRSSQAFSKPNNERAAFDFEETGGPAPKFIKSFFDDANILRADAKRTADAGSARTFISKMLRDKNTVASQKKGLAKFNFAGGYIPKYAKGNTGGEGGRDRTAGALGAIFALDMALNTFNSSVVEAGGEVSEFSKGLSKALIVISSLTALQGLGIGKGLGAVARFVGLSKVGGAFTSVGKGIATGAGAGISKIGQAGRAGVGKIGQTSLVQGAKSRGAQFMGGLKFGTTGASGGKSRAIGASLNKIGGSRILSGAGSAAKLGARFLGPIGLAITAVDLASKAGKGIASKIDKSTLNLGNKGNLENADLNAQRAAISLRNVTGSSFKGKDRESFNQLAGTSMMQKAEAQYAAKIAELTREAGGKISAISELKFELAEEKYKKVVEEGMAIFKRKNAIEQKIANAESARFKTMRSVRNLGIGIGAERSATMARRASLMGRLTIPEGPKAMQTEAARAAAIRGSTASDALMQKRALEEQLRNTQDPEARAELEKQITNAGEKFKKAVEDGSIDFQNRLTNLSKQLTDAEKNRASLVRKRNLASVDKFGAGVGNESAEKALKTFEESLRRLAKRRDTVQERFRGSPLDQKFFLKDIDQQIDSLVAGARNNPLLKGFAEKFELTIQKVIRTSMVDAMAPTKQDPTALGEASLFRGLSQSRKASVLDMQGEAGTNINDQIAKVDENIVNINETISNTETALKNFSGFFDTDEAKGISANIAKMAKGLDDAAKGLVPAAEATSAISTATEQTVELAKKAQEIFTKVDQSLGIQDVRITNLRDKLAGIETQLNNQ